MLVPQRGLLGQPSPEVRGAEGTALGEEPARRIHLAPRVPEQHPPDTTAVEIVDDALAERLLPIAHRLKPRIEVAHRLVPDVEQIRVEERQVRGVGRAQLKLKSLKFLEKENS